MTDPSQESDLMPPRNPSAASASINTDGESDRNHSSALTSPPYQSTMDPSTMENVKDHNENKEGLSYETKQELTSTHDGSMDSSILQDGNGHFEKKGLTFNELEHDGLELASTLDGTLDSSIVQDGRDHYENKGVQELSRGNKEYLMLVHTENGDDQEDVLDVDGKFHDSLDIEGREFGYRTSGPVSDLKNRESSSDEPGKDAKITADNQKTKDVKERR
ncbi:uncharacterized protein LOC124261675 [Haliotis rubra]|uniref:uncharacterized protein LOC124261675 n=1 Tax=Haliotis rubra TaxID=36100 RepID=UPI001EE5AFAA|nr:uncharacterized protein LOC124261675 [Haliotis rubra]XP_046551981.1 uncharacterized protein LOC124261675 [Haliotis rubra]XP_046551982.1 uncharacterized protein LOC124261675 [Haliotis rubra]